MPPCSTGNTTMHSAAPDDLLVQLAELLGRVVCAEGTDAAVGVVVGPQGFELHLRATHDGEHVAGLLCGFDAPPEWDVVGVMALGRAYHIDHGRDLAVPIAIVHLQTRRGETVSVLGPLDGPLEVFDDVAEGRVADACRRSLGLATAAPTESPLRWWAGRWLDELCAQPGLESVRHEAELVATFPGGLPFGPQRDLRALEAHGLLLESTYPWGTLREAVAAGRFEVPGIDRHQAAWMDDGMFARWALAELPTPASSLVEVTTRLDGGVAQRLVELLRRWQVIDTAPAGRR